MAINQDLGLSDIVDRTAIGVAASPSEFAGPSSPEMAVTAPPAHDDRRIRHIDIALALMALTLILPVLVLIAIAIKCTSAGPVIFAHDRVGRGGRLFACLKFRSMTVDADDILAALLASDPSICVEWARTHKLRHDPRVTRLGAWLRKTSLDELPQLLNVLRGDMSLVGPRPIVPGEIYRYGRYIRHYCSVRPGITGMWQINGRNDASYSRRVALDIVYVRSRSLALNLYILAMTIPCVILAEGTY